MNDKLANCLCINVRIVLRCLTPLSELTFTNTRLVSNGGISLGMSFITLEIFYSLYFPFSLLSYVHACTFSSFQIKDFPIMPLSINDSVYGSLFFSQDYICFTLSFR